MIAHPRHAEIAEYQEKYNTLAFETYIITPSTVVTLCTIWFNIQKFHILPTQYIYVIYLDLRTNSDYIPVQH